MHTKMILLLLDTQQELTSGRLSRQITDASDYGFGAILEQGGRPVICISRRMGQAERNSDSEGSVDNPLGN